MLGRVVAMAIFASLMPLAQPAAPAQESHTLASDGSTGYAIVVDADAGPADRTAARELKVHLEAATGAAFPIVEQEPAGQALYVGSGARFRTALPDTQSLGPDGIRVASRGDSIYFGGQGPRGALYAVFTFLEDVVGCRWWTPSESHIPRVSRLTVPTQDLAYTPPIRVREAFYYNAFDPVFAARNKMNGSHQEIPENYGGHHRFIGWCHTFFPILPPETYFDAHPEWYSMVDGHRVSDGQLCLTNMEMRAEFIRNVLDWVRNDPSAGMISISQNDWRRQCECPACAALAAEEGSEAGPLIHFVNAVAEAVETEYPEFIVETLAYQYTRKAPRHVKPRHNVAVRLCSIECDFSEPLATGERNADFLQDIQEWSAISSQLYIWNYVTNFANFLYPHPNWDGLAPDLRLFVQHKAVGVFEQGDRRSTCGDFHALRPWVLSKLLWNPQLDMERLVQEFLSGYYGPAGGPLWQYIGLTREAARKADTNLRCFHRTTADWLTLDDLNQATRLFDEAAALVAGDPILTRRLEIARMPLDFVWLSRYTQAKREVGRTGAQFLGPENPAALRDAFVRKVQLFDCEEYGEAHLFAHAIPGLQRLFEPSGSLPAELATRDPDTFLYRPARAFQTLGDTRTAALVPDDAAPDGIALRLPGHAVGVQVVYPMDVEMAAHPGRICYLLLRAEGLAETGPACAIGIYSKRGDGEMRQRRIVNMDDIAADGYTAVRLENDRPQIDRHYFVESLGEPDRVDAVYIAGLYLASE